MADFGAPVAQNINPPQPLQTISSLLGIKQQQTALQQQQQQLQTGQYQQQTAQAQAIQQQQTAKEVQAGSKLLADPVGNGITDATGKPTPQAYTIIKQSMPMTGDARYNDLMTAATGAVNYKNSWTNLRQDQRNIVSARMAGAAADPNATPTDVKNSVDMIRADFKGTPAEDDINTLADVAQQGIDKVAPVHGMTGVRQLVNGLSRGGIGNAAISGPQGLVTPQPAEQNTGSAIIAGTRAPAIYGGGFSGSTATRTNLPPGITILTDANKNQYRYNTQTGKIEGKVGNPGAGSVGDKGFTQPIPGADAAQADIESTRKADADYGVNRHINNQILDLSKDTSTGPGTDIWHHALGAIAGPGGGNNVSDYQTIGAYLDRQAALSTRQMGLPDTNAGLATAASLSGTTGYQPKALQTKVKLTDALVEGAHQYRQGLDNVVGTGPNQDLSKYQQYRAEWTKNFDPTIYLLENAKKRSDQGDQADQAEYHGLINSLSPEQAASLRQKRQNLMALSSGQLPQ